MPEPIESQETETHEVDKPVQSEGQIQFMTKGGISNPAPIILKRVIAALRMFSLTLIGIVAAADGIPTDTRNTITLGLVIFGALLEAVKVGTGVVPIPDDK